MLKNELLTTVQRLKSIGKLLISILLVLAIFLLFWGQKLDPQQYDSPWWYYQFRGLMQISVLFVLWTLISISLDVFKHSKYIWIWRTCFLIASVVYLGFITGGCMCVVGYVQGAVFFLMGKNALLPSFIVTLLFLVMAYFYGKVWCGWLCPLGAFQEMLYLGNYSKIRTSSLFLFFKLPIVHKVLRLTQVASFIALILVLIIKSVPFFCQIDPFRAIFRLHIEGTLMWSLSAILIISSLLIYRPFCQAFCPMGFLMNLVQHIPGAHRIQLDHEGCKRCMRCEKRCRMDAIRNANVATSCIACGDCLGLHCKYLSGDIKISGAVTTLL